MPFTGPTATTTAMSLAECADVQQVQRQTYKRFILLRCNRIRVVSVTYVHDC